MGCTRMAGSDYPMDTKFMTVSIAGDMVEGPARSAGGSSLAPTIARREAAGALAYSMTPVNRSPNSRANWGMAADHLGVARFQEAVKFMMAR